MNKMYKIICLFFCICASFLHSASGQFSFGSSDNGYSRFKLSGPLGQLISGQSPLNLMSSNYGFGQILGSLINGASSSSGGPLSQLATAASTQYINAIRSNPLLSQFTGTQSSQSAPPQPSPYGAPHQHSPHAMFNPMQNPMALLGADNSMYVPPGPQPGFDSHFGGSSVFPQFVTPDNYFAGGQYGGPSSQPIPSYAPSPYGPHLSSPIHHLDRKK